MKEPLDAEKTKNFMELIFDAVDRVYEEEKFIKDIVELENKTQETKDEKIENQEFKLKVESLVDAQEISELEKMGSEIEKKSAKRKISDSSNSNPSKKIRRKSI